MFKAHLHCKKSQLEAKHLLGEGCNFRKNLKTFTLRIQTRKERELSWQHFKYVYFILFVLQKGLKMAHDLTFILESGRGPKIFIIEKEIQNLHSPKAAFLFYKYIRLLLILTCLYVQRSKMCRPSYSLWYSTEWKVGSLKKQDRKSTDVASSCRSRQIHCKFPKHFHTLPKTWIKYIMSPLLNKFWTFLPIDSRRL